MRSNNGVEDIYRHWDDLVAQDDLPVLASIVSELVVDPPRTERQLEQTEAACRELGLDGLVLVGGPVSASDTACLAERFAEWLALEQS